MIDQQQMEEIEQGTEQFCAQMRERLVVNLHKGGWKNESSGYLLQRLLEEIAELVHELDEGTAESIGEEAADVANLAMMLGDPERIANVMKKPS